MKIRILLSRKLFKTPGLDKSSSPEFDLFSNLEGHFEEEVAGTMMETMEEYMCKTRGDYGSGVTRPKIDAKDHFELKGQFLKELCDNTFCGLDHEDANEHIEKVLEIVDLFHIPNITQDQIMLRAFPMSLTGAASRWLRNKPFGSIITLKDLKTKFLNKTRSTETSNGLPAIQAQLNNLGREIKKVNEKVYVAQVGCELYYIELNDMNEPLELRRNRVDDLEPTVEEDVIVGEPFCKASCVEARRFNGIITIRDGDDSVTYQMVRSNPRFKHLTNEKCNKIPALLKVSEQDKMNGISHSYQKLKGFYKGVLNLGPEFIRDAKVEEWLTRGHISVHEME
ncbi:hypothetical protein Tco_0205316 [Tanacetum coccineum]